MEPNYYGNGVKNSSELAKSLLANVNRLWRELTLKSKPSQVLVKESLVKIKIILQELDQTTADKEKHL